MRLRYAARKGFRGKNTFLSGYSMELLGCLNCRSWFPAPLVHGPPGGEWCQYSTRLSHACVPTLVHVGNVLCVGGNFLGNTHFWVANVPMGK